MLLKSRRQASTSIAMLANGRASAGAATFASVEAQPARLQAALIKVTETLAYELAKPTASAPDWSEFEWHVGRAVAAMHGVSPLLATVLRWRGPPTWVQFLKQQRAHTAQRHQRIEGLLEDIDRRACHAGIPVLALKGAALHAAGVYQAGDRPMADIDLLVRPQDSVETVALLQSMGYHETRFELRDREFSPVKPRIPSELGEHADNDVKIELHERISEALPRCETDVTEIIFPRRSRPGLNPYPSIASLMLHLLLHASGGMVARSLRLIQLHDVAALALKMNKDDWEEFRAYGAGGKNLWWVFPALHLVSRYYAGDIPPASLAESLVRCPSLLSRVSRRQTLSDVSLSHLWVHAFPGIEWSQSVVEMLRYAGERIRPGADHISKRKRAANTEAWASRAEWVRLSQSRRILRWIFTQPVRTRTMHAVRTALGQLDD
jgi:hypothetical protein